MSSTNVQLGATYSIGRDLTRFYAKGCTAAARYINAEIDEGVRSNAFQPRESVTRLKVRSHWSFDNKMLRNLPFAMKWDVGDEIIVSKLDHEANIAA
jgi:hypothetical protein